MSNDDIINYVLRLQVLLMSKQIDPGELDFLLRFPVTPNVVSPVDFLSHQCWGGIKALSNMEQFRDLDKDIEVRKFVLRTYIFQVMDCFSEITEGRSRLS